VTVVLAALGMLLAGRRHETANVSMVETGTTLRIYMSAAAGRTLLATISVRRLRPRLLRHGPTQQSPVGRTNPTGRPLVPSAQAWPFPASSRAATPNAPRRMLPAAAATLALPTTGAIATSRPWASSSVTPASAARLRLTT
jgi:hypothetical protein